VRCIIIFIVLNFIFFSLTGCSYNKHMNKHKADKQKYNAHFGDIDADGDDLINLEEFNNYFPHAKKKAFKKADMNKDKLLDHEEWHTFKANRGYKHKK